MKPRKTIVGFVSDQDSENLNQFYMRAHTKQKYGVLADQYVFTEYDRLNDLLNKVKLIILLSNHPTKQYRNHVTLSKFVDWQSIQKFDGKKQITLEFKPMTTR